MINSILVVWEYGRTNEVMLSKAGKLAKATGARVTLEAYLDPDQNLDGNKDSSLIVERTMRLEAEQHLAEVEDLTVEIKMPSDAAQAVMDDQVSQHFDLVIKCYNNDSEFLKSSLDWHLIRGLTCPLLIVHAHKERVNPVVLATIDIDEANEKQQHMNQAVLDWSCYLAELNQSQLHAMYNIPMSKVTLELDVFEPREVLGKKGDDARARLSSIVKKHSAATSKLHVLAGDIAKNLRGETGKLRPQLLVVGSVGRKGIKGMLLGNTAEKILKNTRCDVLIVKSHGSELAPTRKQGVQG